MANDEDKKEDRSSAYFEGTPGWQPQKESADEKIACPLCASRINPGELSCWVCGGQLVAVIEVHATRSPQISYAAAKLLAPVQTQRDFNLAQFAKQSQNVGQLVQVGLTLPDALELAAEICRAGAVAEAYLIGAEPEKPAADNASFFENLLDTVQSNWKLLATLGIIAGLALAAKGLLPEKGVYLDPIMEHSTADMYSGRVAAGVESETVAERTKKTSAAVGATGKETSAQEQAKAVEAFSFASVKPSVVTVLTPEGGQGSGFIAAPGYVITNHHVVSRIQPGERLRIRFNDKVRTVEKTVVLDRVRPAHDLALLRCDDGCGSRKVLPLGEATSLEVGDEVYAVGSPGGLELSLTKGIISQRGRRLDQLVLLQSDVSVNPGNSGGPLFDKTGRVVGVVVGKLQGAEGIGFIIPIEYAFQGTDPLLKGIIDTLPHYSPAMSKLIVGATDLPFSRPDSGTPTLAQPSDGSFSLTGAYVLERYRNGYALFFELELPIDEQLDTSDEAFVMELSSRGEVVRLPLGRVRPVSKLSRHGDGTATYRFEYAGVYVGALSLRSSNVRVVYKEIMGSNVAKFEIPRVELNISLNR